MLSDLLQMAGCRDTRYTDQRNVLVLCASADLDNWVVLERLLEDDTGLQPQDSVRYTGFHYVDWQYDGAGLIYLIRIACEHSHHPSRVPSAAPPRRRDVV